MIEKKVFCSFCGKALFTITFETSDNCHVQRATISGACDVCNKGMEISWDVGELDQERARKRAAAIARARELVSESQPTIVIASEVVNQTV